MAIRKWKTPRLKNLSEYRKNTWLNFWKNIYQEPAPGAVSRMSVKAKETQMLCYNTDLDCQKEQQKWFTIFLYFFSLYLFFIFLYLFPANIRTFYLNLLPVLGIHIITQLTSEQLCAEEQNYFEFCLSLTVWGNLSWNQSGESTNMSLTSLAWAEVTGGDSIPWYNRSMVPAGPLSSKSPLWYFPYAKLPVVRKIWRGEQLEIQ